jgi:hypothetical protein
MSPSARNFFISYRRKSDVDRELAHFLSEGLKRAKHEVFIDVEMLPGTDWVNEIGHRIDNWCHYLVVLLSEKSIHSEMVQGEIRRAHQRRKSDGTPLTVPIRIKYDGSLGYELDGLLARLQYVRWNSIADSQRILDILLRIASGGDGSPGAAPSQKSDPPALPAASDRPMPAADPRIVRVSAEDPRVVRAPGGTISPNDPFYVEGPSDGLVRERAALAGDTVVIKGPRQMGKSSLLIRYLMACRDNGKRLCLVDFQQFSDEDLADYMTFLSRLWTAIQHELELDGEPEVAFKDQQRFSFHVENRILKTASGPVVLAFDEVDRILGRSYQENFFGMLRLWHNKRGDTNTRWKRADLALVIATDPYLLIKREMQSPFNVTVPVELTAFTRQDLDFLNARHGTPLRSDELDRLFALLAGHPYLTRLAFYRLAARAMPFETLVSEAAKPDGPFGDHLRSRLLLLQHQPELVDAMRRLATSGRQPQENAGYLLTKTGMAIADGDRLLPANEVYGRFFKVVR